jgi:hypothetical protein
MTPRLSTPRTPTPRSYDEIQNYLLNNTKIFVTYLRQACLSLNHIGDMLNSDDSGRLFFENDKFKFVDSALLKNISMALSRNNIFMHFEKRLLFWQPLFDEDNILLTRKFFLEYYFLPIQQSDEYKSFITEQIEKAKEASPSDIDNLIGGAILFRLISEWKRHHPAQDTEKAALLAKVLNLTLKPTTIIQRAEQETTNNINNAFITFETFIKNSKAKKDKFLEELVNVLANIHSNLYFQGLREKGYEILTHKLVALLTQGTLHKSTYTNGILTYYNANFDKTDDGMMKLIETICGHAKESMIKKFHHIIEHVDTQKKISESKQRSLSEPNLKKDNYPSIFEHSSNTLKVPAFTRSRTISTPPPVASETVVPGTNDASLPSPSPRTPDRIYAKRDAMRRRASSATLFTPRNNEKDLSPAPTALPNAKK